MCTRNDSIEKAKVKGENCAKGGMNVLSNPYRNLPASKKVSALIEAFEEGYNNQKESDRKSVV